MNRIVVTRTDIVRCFHAVGLESRGCYNFSLAQFLDPQSRWSTQEVITTLVYDVLGAPEAFVNVLDALDDAGTLETSLRRAFRMGQDIVLNEHGRWWGRSGVTEDDGLPVLDLDMNSARFTLFYAEFRTGVTCRFVTKRKSLPVINSHIGTSSSPRIISDEIFAFVHPDDASRVRGNWRLPHPGSAQIDFRGWR